MYKDDFRRRYTTIPVATFARKNNSDTLSKDVTTLAHKHKEMEVLAVCGGTARFYVDTRSYEVKKGDIIIISPFMLHNATIYAGKEFKHYCVCFDLEMFSEQRLCEELESGKIQACHLVTDPKLSELLFTHVEGAFMAHAGQKSGWELQTIGHLSIFLGLLKEYGCFFHVTGSDSENINFRIIDYIENNYKENISSSDVANSLFVSKSYFCRIFKKNFGYCFQQYLCMYRIEQAKILLLTTDMSIAEIALQTGFGSFSYFGKMFRMHLQMTPSEYRKSHYPVSI